MQILVYEKYLKIIKKRKLTSSICICNTCFQRLLGVFNSAIGISPCPEKLNRGSYSPTMLNLRRTKKFHLNLFRYFTNTAFKNEISMGTSFSAFEVKYLPGENDVVDGEDK